MHSLSLLALLGFLWGSSYSLVAYALPTIPPLTLCAIRVSLSALILTAYAFSRGYSFPRDSMIWRRLFLQGAINPATSWVLITWGQVYVGGGLASIINTLSPMFSFLIAVLWTHHELVTRKKLCGVLLGFAGVIAVLAPSVIAGFRHEIVAEIAILAGTIGFAVTAILARRLGELPAPVIAAGTLLRRHSGD